MGKDSRGARMTEQEKMVHGWYGWNITSYPILDYNTTNECYVEKGNIHLDLGWGYPELADELLDAIADMFIEYGGDDIIFEYTDWNLVKVFLKGSDNSINSFMESIERINDRTRPTETY